MPFTTTPEHKGREEGLTEGLAKDRAEGLIKGIEVALKLKVGRAGLRLLLTPASQSGCRARCRRSSPAVALGSWREIEV